MTTFAHTMSTSAWQRPLHYTSPVPAHPSSHSGWVALEKTPKEKDTSKLIQKANDQATLLLELLNLGDKPSSLQDLRENEILQQVYKSCQDFAAELVERIAEDDQVDELPPTTTTFDYSVLITTSSASNPAPSSSSSSNPAHHLTLATEKEAQIAALLAAVERLQLAFKEYDELQDFLHAKQLQSAEDYYANEAALADPAVETLLEEEEEEEEEEDDDQEESLHQQQPRSQQPIEYMLDPRPDYRANQQRLKNGKVTMQRVEALKERAREKHKIDPIELMNASLYLVKEDKEVVQKDDGTSVQGSPLSPAPAEAASASASENETVSSTLEKHDNDKDGYLSDSSWQEVPDDVVESGSTVDEIASGTSSIIVVPAQNQ